MYTDYKMNGINEGKYSIGHINALQYNRLDGIENKLSSSIDLPGIEAGEHNLAAISGLIYSQLFNIQSRLYTGLDLGLNDGLSNHNVSTIAGYIYLKLNDLDETIKNKSDTGISIDLDKTNEKLDELIRLQKQAMTADLLKALIGDGEMNKIAEATTAVEQAVTNAFPFCIPALLKQILGLMNTEAKAPEIHYVIWGASLDVYFDDFKSLADVTCWLSRIFFIISLLTVTRRFIFAGETAI